MIYLIVDLKFQPAREADFFKVMQEEYLPILVNKYKWKLIASWRIQIGDLHRIINIWSFNTINEFWDVRMKMFHDTEYTARRDRLHSLLTDETISFATPLPSSPM